MRGRWIGCLPVINRGRLAGIVTVTDLLELPGRGAEIEQHRLEAHQGAELDPATRRY
jgi:CBS domain-containing protein